MENLSNEEIFMLSEGLLALIHNCSEACKLVPDRKAQEEIYNAIYKYQKLNSKLMDRIRDTKEWYYEWTSDYTNKGTLWGIW